MMFITDESIPELKKFSELGLEDIFRYDGRLFMKISYCCTNEAVNAYDFTSHEVARFSSYIKVTPYPAELVLHEPGWCGRFSIEEE